LAVGLGQVAAVVMTKLAMSMLCENPLRKTGLTTLFHEFVEHGLRLFPDISWLLFAGPEQPWSLAGDRVEVCRDFPANDRLGARLRADHFHVSRVAEKRGARALITVGFVPWRKTLPTIMHVFSLQHLSRDNRVGWGREIYRRWLMKRSWPKADLVITNSKFAVGQLRSVLPGFEDRILQSYEGLQHEQFHPRTGLEEAARLKDELGLEPGYFLWISNFYPYKQPELLLRGYALLDESLRRRHPLVMVGGDWENTLAATRRLARELGIERDVKFPGWVADAWLAPLYRQAQAFCLASREETFGRCVIESMACGTPCIVNDIPIMEEVTGGSALTVDYRDAPRVAGALREMAEDRSSRERLRQKGISGTLRFDFDKLATERIEAIRRLLSGRTAAGFRT
jgi:glycosyltransferase involved in cell wall biosynthesis